MNWRRWIGIDPAVPDGGVVIHRLASGGEIRVDVDRLQQSVGTGLGFSRLAQEFANYSPSDSRGNPLGQQGKKTQLSQLHLEDYRPRNSEHPVGRLTFERSFPEQELLTEEQWSRHFMLGHRTQPSTWVDYRNRHPVAPMLIGEFPPMRDALADLLDLLNEVADALAVRELVAVETAVRHEPAAHAAEGERQGWHFAVEVFVVPAAVLEVEQERYDMRIAAQQD